MKTAEERIDDQTNFGGKAQTKDDLVILIKQYAFEVAQQALKDANDRTNDALNYLSANKSGFGDLEYILRTPIKLP